MAIDRDEYGPTMGHEPDFAFLSEQQFGKSYPTNVSDVTQHPNDVTHVHKDNYVDPADMAADATPGGAPGNAGGSDSGGAQGGL